MAGVPDAPSLYEDIDLGKVINKVGLLELCSKIKQYISNNSSGGSSIRIIHSSNLADSTSADYAYLDDIVTSYTYSPRYIDWGNLFCIENNNMLFYPTYAKGNSTDGFIGFTLISTGVLGRISTRELTYANGTWTLSNSTMIYAPTAGTGISVTDGVISLDLTNANGVSY